MERGYCAAGTLENMPLPPLTSRASQLLSCFRHWPGGGGSGSRREAGWHEGKFVADVSGFSSSRRGCWSGPLDERRILYGS